MNEHHIKFTPSAVYDAAAKKEFFGKSYQDLLRSPSERTWQELVDLLICQAQETLISFPPGAFLASEPLEAIQLSMENLKNSAIGRYLDVERFTFTAQQASGVMEVSIEAVRHPSPTDLVGDNSKRKILLGTLTYPVTR